LKQDIGTDLQAYLPFDPLRFGNAQTALPNIAKDDKLTAQIEQAIQRIPTWHRLYTRMLAILVLMMFFIVRYR
jgi:hypothetical protein